MSENVPFKISKEALNLNQLRALNTTDRSIQGSRDPYANGTRAPEGGHLGSDPKYEHWCRPEPTREMPWKSADVERAREKQGGMQDDTPGLKRASNGGVIGSQRGVIPPKDSPHFQSTEWGEYDRLDQWDKGQSGTYRGESREPFDDD